MRTNDPSDRDFEIFTAIEFEHVSLRAAAERFQLSPTRIGQIVAAVRAWYVASTPEWIQQISAAVQPLVACRFHDAQLQQLTGEAMRAWHASKGATTTRHEREGLAGGASTTTTISHGQTRYLAAAAKLSEMRIRAAERMAKIAEGQSVQAAPPAAVTVPPEMPCAREVQEPAPEATHEEDVVALSIAVQEACELRDEPATVAMFAARTPERAKLERKLARKQRRQRAKQLTQLGT